MQLHYRTSERTGVSVGPFGLLVLGPVYLAVMVAVGVFYAAAVAVGLALRLLLELAAAVASRRVTR